MTELAPQSPPPLMWAHDTDACKASEIARLGEIHLDDAVRLALASDARSTSTATALSAVSAGLLAVSATVLGLTDYDWRTIAALLTSAIGFIIAAGFAVAAARPVAFVGRGYNPSRLSTVAGDKKDLAIIVAQTTAWKIDIAARAAQRSASLFDYAIRIAAAAVITPALMIVATLIYDAT